MQFAHPTITDTALFKRIKELAKDQIDQKACFVAGTMVHTKDGLKPIEEIKVGDYVLSKPENGGELAYKRVTKTYVRENAEVWGVTYEVDRGEEELIVTTAEHPFWVPSLRVKDPSVQFGGMMIPHNQWVKPEEMFKITDNFFKGKGESARHYLSTYDGKECGVVQATPICVATNSTRSAYTYTGHEFAVLWPVSPNSQREQEGGWIIERHHLRVWITLLLGWIKKAVTQIKPLRWLAQLNTILVATNPDYARCIT